MRRLAFLVTGLALLVAGCTLVWFRQPGLDISGRWSGTWAGHGILSIPREERVTAEFEQRGKFGRGVLILDGTLAVESMPLAVRSAGASGSRVLFEVSGQEILVKHELGSQEFVAEFRVAGDRMVGRIVDAHPPIRIVLARERPPVAGKPAGGPRPPAEAPPPPPPPPPPGAESAVPPAPSAPAPESPVAAAPPAPEPGAEPAPPSTPEAAPSDRPGLKDFALVPELKSVYFAFNQSDIRPEDVAVLDEDVQWLKGHDVVVLIEGHADERGTNEYNLALGERRAKSVRDYLVSHGVDTDRLNTVSYGEEHPACAEQTEDCWQRNRRVDLLVKPR